MCQLPNPDQIFLALIHHQKLVTLKVLGNQLLERDNLEVWFLCPHVISILSFQPWSCKIKAILPGTLELQSILSVQEFQ